MIFATIAQRVVLLYKYLLLLHSCSSPLPTTMSSRWTLGRNTAQRNAIQRRKGPPRLPVELWQKIFGHMPRTSQLACLLVCRWFYQMCLPFAFKTLKFHMESSYFDHCNSWFPEKDKYLMRWDSALQSQEALQYIGASGNPSWVNFVENVTVIVRDSSSMSHFQLLTTALRRLPRLKEFHLSVTSWRHGDAVQRLDHRPIQTFVHEVFRTSSELCVVTLPPLLAYNAFSALLSLRKLHTVILYEKLHSPSATLPRAVVDELRYQFHHPLATHARFLSRQLRELTIDESLIPVIPKEVLHHLKRLEILNVAKSNRLGEALEACKRLESLTVHEVVGYSNCLTNSGMQLGPHERDEQITLYGGQESHRIFYLLSTRPDLMPSLTAFKYVQYATVLPVEICQYLEAFLSKRRRLEMLDINAVMTNVDVTRKVLKVIKGMRQLTVLGLEYREPRNAFSNVTNVLAEIPKNVTRLRFAVHGWNLFDAAPAQRMSAVDWVIQQALNALPRLTFLHISDGVERPSGLEADKTSLHPAKLKRLSLLGIENCWYDVIQSEQRPMLVAWDPRQVFWHTFVDKMRYDADWLMRYHRDVRGPI
ncbi:hypothetical protein BDY19DRAFT_934415 [Irpex rosettiformis]|uniref:Uncharacterized protein n=1 Tax=Irpex rosettiformis TaxID=378272 RepID=A0ACB8UB55_9APHY|nr:hypothetical protein BDY19DRAFT_934415 [Irpex rosettiformis]